MGDSEKKTSKRLWGWQYVGAGASLAGVPAKDVSVAEARRRGIDPAVLNGSALFVQVYEAPEEAPEEGK